MTNAHQMRHNPNSIHELQQYRASLINIPREAGSLPTAGLGFIAMAAPLACPVKPSLQPQKPYKLSYNISTFMRRNVETLPDQASSASIRSALEGIEGGSLIALLYVLDRAPTGSDVWPDNRDQAKVPVKLTPIYCTSKRTYGIDVTTAEGRPVGSCHGRRTDHTNKSLPKERTPVSTAT